MMDRADVPDAVAAAAFWRLIDHLGHRTDAQNVDLMGLAGFCRNCLSDWLQQASEEAGLPLEKADARRLVYGMDYDAWKARHQAPATPEQLARMEESVRRNKA